MDQPKASPFYKRFPSMHFILFENRNSKMFKILEYLPYISMDILIINYRITREYVQQNQDGQVKKILKILGDDFAGSSNPNTRKGGLIGLAAAAIALGKVIDISEPCP